MIGCQGQCGAGQRTDNMGKSLLFLAMTAIAVSQCWELPPEYTRTPLGDNIDKATLKLLKVAYDSASDKNVVSSPLSLMMLLALYNNGAGPATREEITKFLGGTDVQKTSDSFRALSDEFSNMSQDYLTLANKVYISNKLTLDDNFSAVARSYHSEVENIDFTRNKEAAAAINKWASEKTRGNINSPVSEDALTPDTVLGLFNVIYFKGHWHVPFKPEETKEKDFHVSRSEVVKKPMMHLTQSLYYTESKELGARMVELPYKETGFRMVIVLPDEVDGLPSVLAKATEHGLLKYVFDLAPAGRDVNLELPRFEIKSHLDLNNLMPKVGLSKIFQEAAPGLAKGLPVVVSKAIQEAFIKVDEEGATAGAFTAFINAGAALYEPPKICFIADHPFLFAILYKDKVLFAGTYVA